METEGRKKEYMEKQGNEEEKGKMIGTEAEMEHQEEGEY